MEQRVAPAGDRAWLVEVPGASAAWLRAAAERVRREPGIDACVIGESSLLMIGADARGVLAEVEAGESRGVTHRIGVTFDGPDFPELLDRFAISRAAFLDRISSLTLTVRYLGFRAGWAYLEGWPAEWAMPRRPTSRTRVPRGSFAVAGTRAGFYAVESAGGWNLLGRTEAPLWDPWRESPNLLAAGDEIRIVPEDETSPAAAPHAVPAIGREPSRIVAEVLAPGQLTMIVPPFPDWRRVAHGLPPGGAFDSDTAALANLSLGNPANARVLECTLVAPHLRFRRPTRISIDGEVRTVEELAAARLRTFRSWIAIERGIADHGPPHAEAPARLRGGDVIETANEPLSTRPQTSQSRTGSDEIRVLRGPHESGLGTIECEVTSQLDRAGIRLRPLHPPSFRPPADLPSCGMQFGSVQWHPDGSLIVMGPESPVTGGYLQPLTVLSSERWKLAQLAPGQRVTLAV